MRCILLPARKYGRGSSYSPAALLHVLPVLSAVRQYAFLGGFAQVSVLRSLLPPALIGRHWQVCRPGSAGDIVAALVMRIHRSSWAALPCPLKVLEVSQPCIRSRDCLKRSAV